jgi:CBS domain-containing protein
LSNQGRPSIGEARVAKYRQQSARRHEFDAKNCALLHKICGARSTIVALNPCRRAKKIMKVQDIMNRDVHTCRPETNLAMAAMQMWDGDFGVLPVLADGGKVVGMITDRDICMAAATKHCDPATIRVEEVTTGEVYGCSPDTDIHEALKIMQQRQVRRLPVINAYDGKLAGILSLNDIALKAQADGKAELSAQDVENTLKAICGHRR